MLSRGSTRSRSVEHGAGEGVPGVGIPGGGWEGYTGTPPDTLPGTHISHILALSPTYGQMKAKLRYL